MKNLKAYFWFAVCALVAGCAHQRSISHSDYPSKNSWRGPGGTVSDAAFQYRGELSEFDVLGINPDENISEDDIRNAQQNGGRLRLRPGTTILLVQSGAAFPDKAMVTELSRYFRIVPFTGVPAEAKETGSPSRSNTSVRNAAVVTDGEKPTVTVVPLSNSSETENKLLAIVAPGRGKLWRGHDSLLLGNVGIRE